MQLDIAFQLVSVGILVTALVAMARGRERVSTSVTAAVTMFFVALGFGREPFHIMRLVAWVIFAHLPLALLAHGLLHRKQRWHFLTSLALALLLVAIGVDAFFIEPFRLQTTHYDLAVPRLNESVRVVVLADIQTDSVGAYEERVFDQVLELAPDLVLLPGDFLQVYDQRRPAQIAKLRALLAGLSPRLGSWAVTGNVDPSDTGKIFEGTGVEYLDTTRTVPITGEIELLGLTLADSFDSTLKLPPSAAVLRIVMGHAPDFSMGSRDDGSTQLFVAGHTHGGQVQLPLLGPPITLSSVPRSQGRGSFVPLSRERTLVVSRGIGMERENAPRLRFLCPPEIVVIDLRPAR